MQHRQQQQQRRPHLLAHPHHVARLEGRHVAVAQLLAQRLLQVRLAQRAALQRDRRHRVRPLLVVAALRVRALVQRLDRAAVLVHGHHASRREQAQRRVDLPLPEIVRPVRVRQLQSERRCKGRVGPAHHVVRAERGEGAEGASDSRGGKG